MEKTGVCFICGKSGKIFKCHLCGRNVCKKHYDPINGVCVEHGGIRI